MNVFLEVYKIFYQIKTNGNEYRLPFNEIQNMQINAKYSEKPQLECTKWKSLKFKVTDSDVQRHLVLNLFGKCHPNCVALGSLKQLTELLNSQALEL